LHVHAYDFAGRSTESSIEVFVYNDFIPPTVNLTAPTEGQVLSGTVVFSADAHDDKVVWVEFFVGETSIGSTAVDPYGFNWDSRTIANGEYTVTAVARDFGGNTATSSAQIVIDNDITPPAVSMSAPAPTTTVEGTVILTADASDDRGVTKVQFLVNDTVVGEDTSAPWSFAWNSRTTGNGTTNIKARAYDAAGHFTTSEATSITVANDVLGPSLIILSPVEYEIVSETTTVTALASDDRGVARVEFHVNYVLMHTVTSGPFTFNWDTTAAPGGLNRLEVKALDAAGNSTSRWVYVLVRHDTTPPTVVLTSPPDGASLSGLIPLRADASDNLGVARIEFLVNEVVVGTDWHSPYAFDWDSTEVSNEVHWVTARAWDIAGLSSTSSAVGVLIENTGWTGQAVYNATFGAPTCSVPGAFCTSGSLLKGRGPVGPELNAPNTLGGTCADGVYGTYLSEESVESIHVETEDGTPLAAGKSVVISVGVHAWVSSNVLDIFHTSDASNPNWSRVSTTQAPGRGLHTLVTTMTLPEGSTQALRASFRYAGSSTPCSTGLYDDRDDLVFGVAP
jgi:hypothetical protein